jgi:hypothetical protein
MKRAPNKAHTLAVMLRVCLFAYINHGLCCESTCCFCPCKRIEIHAAAAAAAAFVQSGSNCVPVHVDVIDYLPADMRSYEKFI